MKKDKKEKREIRDILLGKSILTEDGRLTSKDPGTILMPQGVVDGAGAVHLFGISGKDYRYETGLAEDALAEQVNQSMRNLGRALSLREQPEAAACLIRYALTGPAVLVFRCAEGGPVLTVWTARGLMGSITRRRAVGAFAQALPESIRPAAGEKKEKAKREKLGKAPKEDAGHKRTGEGPETTKQEETEA
jgi:hypothetical protein